MSRKVADCRETPSVSGCTLTIAGEEDEVIRAVAEHSVSVHGEKDSPELREEIRASLKEELEGVRTAPSPDRAGVPAH
jgi:predicted small metal-binding protein